MLSMSLRKPSHENTCLLEVDPANDIMERLALNLRHLEFEWRWLTRAGWSCECTRAPRGS